MHVLYFKIGSSYSIIRGRAKRVKRTPFFCGDLAICKKKLAECNQEIIEKNEELIGKIEEMIEHHKNAVLIDHKNHKRTIEQIESYEPNGKQNRYTSTFHLQFIFSFHIFCKPLSSVAC